MSYIVKVPENDGTKFPPLPSGSYGAICYAIVGIGSHFSPAFNKWTRKVMLFWEIPDETIEINGENKPRAISEQYSETLAEKATLRAMLESWRGKSFTEEELKGFDISKLLGKPCLITTKTDVSKKGKEFAKISGVGKLPKGMNLPEKPFNPTFLFNIDDNDALEKMSNLPEWVQERIKDSKEYKARACPQSDGTDFSAVDDDGDLTF